MPASFITYQQLYDDVMAMVPGLPRPIAMVVGVPRSGMLPATMLATELHVPLGMVGASNEFGGDRVRWQYNREGHILVIDDSVYKGGAIRRAKQIYSAAGTRSARVKYGCVYMTPGSELQVDFFGRQLPGPRFFEWNLFNIRATELGMLDMDGVICRDPEAYDDDGPAYQEALRHAVPLHLPQVKVRAICTNRIERWRGITEQWLADHGVEYDELIMQPFDTAEERRQSSSPAGFKAGHYKRLGCPIFIESHDHHAKRIAELSGKPVISLEGRRVYE